MNDQREGHEPKVGINNEKKHMLCKVRYCILVDYMWSIWNQKIFTNFAVFEEKFVWVSGKMQ